MKKMHTSSSTPFYFNSRKCCFHTNRSYKFCRCLIGRVKNTHSSADVENTKKGLESNVQKIEEGGRATKLQSDPCARHSTGTTISSNFLRRLQFVPVETSDVEALPIDFHIGRSGII